MNVLVVSEQWWPEGTGGILASRLIARMLKDVKFKLTVVHGTKEPEIVKDISYIYTKLLNVRNKHKLWISCFILARQIWFLKAIHNCDVVYIPRYCYPLIPLVKKLNKKVIVHLHDYQPISYNAVIFNGTRQNTFSPNADIVKFEVLEHNSIPRAFGAFTAPANMLCRLWLREADIIICVSQRQAEIISNLAPELAHKIRIIYNPLPETPPMEEKFKHPAFIYAGGGSYIKGFYILVEGVLDILKRRNDVSFMFAGSFRHVYKKIAERLNNVFAGRLKLLGSLPHEDVLRLYSRSHAVLIPSICEEPFPYVVMEAMAMGTLPVASKVGGIPEIVKGTYAEKMMFAPGNPDELADRIEAILSTSRVQLVDIGSELREIVLKRFNNENIKRQLLEVFKA